MKILTRRGGRATSNAAQPLTDHSFAQPGVLFTTSRAVLRRAFWLWFRPVVRGTDQVPHTGAVLLVSNHLSALDTLLIPSFAPRPVQFLAKASLFEGRISRWFMRHVGAIPVQRGSHAQAALAAGSRVLAAGRVFALFPEGSRSPDGRLYRGRSGAAFLALETGARVVPVGLIGTQRRCAAHRNHPEHRSRPARVEIHFGAPVALDDLAGKPPGLARSEATSRIMSAICALTGQERAQHYARADA